MQVSNDVADRHSENDFYQQLYTLADAGAGVIHVRTTEIIRCLLALRKTILAGENLYTEWDVANGIRSFDINNINNIKRKGNDDPDVVNVIHKFTAAETKMPNDQAYEFLVVINSQYWMPENPGYAHEVMTASYAYPSGPKRLILLTPDMPIPEPMSSLVASMRFEPPGHGELREYLEVVLEGVDATSGLIDLDEDGKDSICYTASGMTKDAFEMYASIAIVESSHEEDGAPKAKGEETKVGYDDIMRGVSAGKTEIVNKNDLLELYPTESINDVGGMDNLKEWINKRSGCYSDEARDYGIEPPKGIVCVGPPGTGKSLLAKAVASVLGVPLVRLDFGKVFNSLVGASEERMRTALQMVTDMAPCVLFCDEIDKGLGGSGGSGDSGTSSRVLGSYLTWLNDCEAPVFNMVTANNVDGLPPELMRRGRFDAIFSTSFPTRAERIAVLDIHLNKRGWDSSQFTDEDKGKVVHASDGYVPAEIESAVKDGLIASFSNDEEFCMEHVVEALHEMVPLSKAFASKIQKMTVWAKENATPASYPEETGEAAGNDSSNVEPIKRRTRTKRTPNKD